MHAHNVGMFPIRPISRDEAIHGSTRTQWCTSHRNRLFRSLSLSLACGSRVCARPPQVIIVALIYLIIYVNTVTERVRYPRTIRTYNCVTCSGDVPTYVRLKKRKLTANIVRRFTITVCPAYVGFLFFIFLAHTVFVILFLVLF